MRVCIVRSVKSMDVISVPKEIQSLRYWKRQEKQETLKFGTNPL